MEKSELYLKTIFCCMACDGDIATEEVDMVKQLSSKDETFVGVDVETLMNSWIDGINNNGQRFLKKFLNELSEAELSEDEELLILNYAFKTIEADERIEYSEVKFFKKIRARLSVSDEQILQKHPDKEDFLLPDINVYEDPKWDDVHFNMIHL